MWHSNIYLTISRSTQKLRVIILCIISIIILHKKRKNRPLLFLLWPRSMRVTRLVRGHSYISYTYIIPRAQKSYLGERMGRHYVIPPHFLSLSCSIVCMYIYFYMYTGLLHTIHRKKERKTRHRSGGPSPHHQLGYSFQKNFIFLFNFFLKGRGGLYFFSLLSKVSALYTWWSCSPPSFPPFSPPVLCVYTYNSHRGYNVYA